MNDNDNDNKYCQEELSINCVAKEIFNEFDKRIELRDSTKIGGLKEFGGHSAVD